MMAPSISSSWAVSRRMSATSRFSILPLSRTNYSDCFGFEALPFPSNKGGIVEQAGDGFRIANLAAANPSFGFVEREDTRFDPFVIFGTSFAFGQTFGQEDNHPLTQETRARIDFKQLSIASRGVAGFFLQFPRCAHAEVFARLPVAGDELPHELPRGVPVLADDQNSAVVKHRKHNDGTRVSDNLANSLHSRGLDQLVAAHGKHAPCIFRFAA